MTSFERGDIVFNTITGELGEFFKEADVSDMMNPNNTSKYTMVNAILSGGSKVARLWLWTQTAFYEKKKPRTFHLLLWTDPLGKAFPLASATFGDPRYTPFSWGLAPSH